MGPRNPSPTPADDRATSPVARRIGPPLAVTALVVTAAMLAWLALAPTAIAGPLEEAPFTVPATLVLPPDPDGCLRVVEGDGTEREHCLAQFATPEREGRYVEATFDADGRLHVGEYPDDFVEVDPVTGEVLDRDVGPGGGGPADPPRPGDPGEVENVIADGDQVVRDEPDGEVVLDLEAPPGWNLRNAVLSPDGDWVVAAAPDGRVIVAPTDGTTPPYVWAESPSDAWFDLHGAIRWDQQVP